MDRATAIARLKTHEPELRALGIASLSVFGSTARGESRSTSDVDLAASFDEAARVGAFRFAAIAQRLSDMLDARVDLVGEPARKPSMRAEIERDRVRVF
jgi:uncharacterized protein